jgi:hypothetical protein
VFSKFRFKTKGLVTKEESMNLDPYYIISQRIAVALTSNGKNYDNNDIIVALSYFNKPFVIPTFTAITLPPKNSTLFGEYSTGFQ